MNLLIVDDYPTNRKLLRASLEAEQHSVIEAANGLEALDQLGRERVDGVISDILMPTMDGFRLCHEIRQSQRLCKLPLILYTSTYNSPTDRGLAQSVGADAYILKPAPIETLLKAINEARARSAARDIAEPPPLQHAEVLERYNAVLVHKLESRNTELQQTVEKLRAAHEEILELNRNLELRVAQRTSALDAANRELEAFSYSVSHDLRAPLRHISGFAEALNEDFADRLGGEGKAYVGRILTAASQMNRLIEALLGLAHTARTPLDLIEVNLESVLEASLEAVSADTVGRDVRWRRVRLPKALGDAALLQQVMTNLLSNALKYSRTRPHSIIEVGQSDGRTDEVVVYVKDNGVGFDPNQAKELFGVFKRLRHASSFEGTGVGLANVHRIITRMGGTVWAEAQPDHGATFYFSLRRI